MSRFTDFNIKDLASWGKLRANPEGGDDNLIKLAKCDECNNTTPCLDVIEIPESEGKMIESIRIDGVDYAPDQFPLSADNKAAIKDGVCAVLGSGDIQEFNLKVPVCVQDGTTTIYHIGRKKIEGVTVDGELIEATSKCTITKECQYQFPIKEEGEGAAIINGVEFTIDTTDADSVLASLEAEGFDASEVVVDGAIVNVYGQEGLIGTVDGMAFDCCGCGETFTKSEDPCAASEEEKRLSDENKKLAAENEELKTAIVKSAEVKGLTVGNKKATTLLKELTK